MLVHFILLMSGIAFVARISALAVDELRLLRREQMTKIGTTYVLAIVLFALVFTPTAHVLWMVIFAPQILFVFALEWLRSARTSVFQTAFLETLSLLILKMKSGRSLRQALQEATLEAPRAARTPLAEVRDLVVFSQQNANASRFIQRIVCEFRAADRDAHGAVRRLEVFRDRLKCEADFRRRSGQVLAQVRAQSLLLAGLYIAILAITASRFGFAEHARIAILSLSLFCVGQGCIWFGGRKHRWKV